MLAYTQRSGSIFAGKMRETFALTQYFFSTHAIPYVTHPQAQNSGCYYSDEDFAKICHCLIETALYQVIDKSGMSIWRWETPRQESRAQTPQERDIYANYTLTLILGLS